MPAGGAALFEGLPTLVDLGGCDPLDEVFAHPPDGVVNWEYIDCGAEAGGAALAGSSSGSSASAAGGPPRTTARPGIQKRPRPSILKRPSIQKRAPPRAALPRRETSGRPRPSILRGRPRPRPALRIGLAPVTPTKRVAPAAPFKRVIPRPLQL